jgi:hypothetical protein
MNKIDVFSNGEEYRYFTAHFCERCELYKIESIGISINDNCPIEENISKAMFDKEKFPSEYVVRLNNTATWVCKKFIGIDEEVNNLFIKQVLPKIGDMKE